MNPAKIVATAIACTVHGALWVALSQFSNRQRASRDVIADVVHVEWTEVPAPTQTPGRVRKEPNLRTHPRSRLRLSDLGPPADWYSKPPSGSSAATSDGTDDASGKQFAEDSRQAGVLNYLHHALDSALTYPTELSSRGIQGQVRATWIIPKSGSITRSTWRFTDASSPYLRVVVARAIRTVIPVELPESIRQHLTRDLSLSVDFSFEIIEAADLKTVQSKSGVRGRQLSFYRYLRKSIAEWKAGPFSGLGPFAVNFDPLWLIDKASKALSHKAEIDPLERYRDDPEW